MPDEHKLSDLLPRPFLRLIRDRIKAGVSDAEAKFRLNQDEEDSLTGALAQAISTADPLTFRGPGGTFEFQIESYKLRGRGDGAPENRLGADGILQISVSKNGRRVFAKGLPFQAKKFGGFGNAAVRKQAHDLYTTSKTGIIVRYSDTGYSGVNAHDVLKIHAAGPPYKKPPLASLATLFGDTFLDCGIGRMNLSYDRAAVVQGTKGVWVINTVVKAEG